MIDEAVVGQQFRDLAGELNERQLRLWAASEARRYGWGGIAGVARASGLSEETIRKGLRELKNPEPLAKGRVRRAGGGRKRLTEKDPTLLADLERLVDESSRGDPQLPLRWTAKSAAKLADGLRLLGHKVSSRTVYRLLRELGYSLQANQKTKEGASHPDRNAQFQHINATVKDAIDTDQPVISVDTKKKELVGDFKAVGKELRPKGDPIPVRVHDFKDKKLGHAIPYGVYDLTEDTGFVSVGITNDTAQFSVASVSSWWSQLGLKRYPDAKTLTITADCGGSNSYRTRLWKTELQKLANEINLEITVLHFPPGTSKWNKIEHRLFSFISQNWRGKPLTNHEVIINLIAGTTTRTGLEVYAQLDERNYPKGIKVTDTELNAVNLIGHDFHPEWNYTINPSC